MNPLPRLRSFPVPRSRRAIVSIFVLVLIFGIAVGYTASAPESREQSDAQRLAGQPTFKAMSGFLQKIADENGAAYAFNVLREAPLPPNVDTHLLGHVAGDALYEQEGLSGIEVCTPDFRNACSHSIVVGALLDGGEGALEDIGDICRKAPGGKGAYTMCFHGLGHGVLAFLNYEFKDAVKLCATVGTSEYRDREYIECVGGAMMELFGGVHDVALREEVSATYFNTDDPLAPCNEPYVPNKVRPICYTYLTPHLFEMAGANLGFPRPRDYKRAFEFCDRIAVNKQGSQESRDACFQGFGKEFVVLAQDRDVRDIASISNERLKRVFSWCKLADVEDGIASCMNAALASLYWGGENDRNAALRFCSIVNEQPYRDVCHDELIDQIAYYESDPSHRRAFCSELPNTYQDECRDVLIDRRETNTSQSR